MSIRDRIERFVQKNQGVIIVTDVLVTDAHCSTCGQEATEFWCHPESAPSASDRPLPFPVRVAAESMKDADYECTQCGGTVVCAMVPILEVQS